MTNQAGMHGGNDECRTRAELPDVPADKPVHDRAAARAALRSARTSAATVASIAQDPRWTRCREIRRLLVQHPSTPRALARSLASGLPWSDLADVAANTRVPLIVRRQAERTLLERIAGLTVGERISLGRRATSAVLVALFPATQPGVARAILANPRLTEDVAIRIAADPLTPPRVLEQIGEHRSWAERRGVRLALARNPRTPLRTALRAARQLPETDLRSLADDPSVSRLVRLGATRWVKAAARQALRSDTS